MKQVKHGATHDVVFSILTSSKQPVDLSSAEIRLLARMVGKKDAVVLNSTLGDEPGTVIHHLTGDLEVGVYHLEIEVTDNNVVTIAPTDGYAELAVTLRLG